MTVDPCGTRAAYMRHYRAGERACAACVQAQSEYIKQYRASKPKKRQDAAFHKSATFTGERTAMDDLLDKDPPVIGWRKNNHGVWVHTSVYDPHAEKPSELRRQRQAEFYAQRKAAS